MVLGRFKQAGWILVFCFSLVSAATFVRRISGPGHERALGVMVMPEGGFLVVGALEAIPDTVLAYLVRTDNFGFPVWTRTVVEASSSTRIHGVCFRGVDTILVVGEWKGMRIDRDMYAAELDSAGSVRWQRVWGTVGADDVALGVCPGHDGSWLVVGYTLEFGQHDVRLVLIDATGNERITRVFRTAEADYARRASKAANRSYALVGTRWYAGSRYTDGLLLLLDDTCALVRSRLFGGGLWEEFAAVALLPDSGLALVGFSASDSTGNDIFLQFTDSTGQGTRQRRYGRQQNERGIAVAVTTDGLAIAGETFGSDSNGDAELLSVDLAGVLRWERTDGGSGFDCLNSVTALADRGVIAVGQAWDDFSQTSDILLVRTDEWGTVGLTLSPESKGQPPSGSRPCPSVFGLRFDCAAPVRIMSVDGRLVCRLDVGRYWDGTDFGGRIVSPGVYLVQTADGMLLRVVKCGK